MKVSYAICIHNEDESLKTLIESILPFFNGTEDELIIVDDYSSNNKTIEILNEYSSIIKWNKHSLDKNFANQKNYMNSLCSGDWIINLDADEFLSKPFMENLHFILEANQSTDLIWIPRVNIVEGITDNHLKTWGWQLTDSPYGKIINWPDYQGRIYKNSPDIKWQGNVHERIIPKDNFSYMPEQFDYVIVHKKSIEKQEIQNQFYSRI